MNENIPDINVRNIDYISRQAAIIEMMDNDVDHAQGTDGREVVQILEDIPAADVVPVVHSTWIEDEGEGYHGIHCLRCGFLIPYGNVMMGYNFCPHCGSFNGGKNEV